MPPALRARTVCYVVAVDKIARVLPAEVLLGRQRIPLSKTYREGLLSAFGAR